MVSWLLMIVPLWVNLISTAAGYRETPGGTILWWGCIGCASLGFILHVRGHVREKRLRREAREQAALFRDKVRQDIDKIKALEAEADARFWRRVGRRQRGEEQ